MRSRGTRRAKEEAEQCAREAAPAPTRIETPEEDSKAPYFTSWLRPQLVDKYGAGEAFGGGLDVTSTLDLTLQNEASKSHTAAPPASA